MTYDHTDLMELIYSRRSVRSYCDRPVDPDLLETLLRAAQWAPSAANRQAYRFFVVQKGATIEELAQIVADRVAELKHKTRPDLQQEMAGYLRNFCFFAEAPVLIVPIYRSSLDLLAASTGAQGTSQDDSLVSVSAAIMNLLLAIQAAGLASCWMTGPLVAAQQLEERLLVPRGWSITALIPLGYAAEQPLPPKRRPLKTLVRYIDGE